MVMITKQLLKKFIAGRGGCVPHQLSMKADQCQAPSNVQHNFLKQRNYSISTLCSTVVLGHTWILSIGNVPSNIKRLDYEFFMVISFNQKDNKWLVTTISETVTDLHFTHAV